MEPNDLPIVCIPLELPDEAAAELLESYEISSTPSNDITSASCINCLKRSVHRILIAIIAPSDPNPIRRSKSVP